MSPITDLREHVFADLDNARENGYWEEDLNTYTDEEVVTDLLTYSDYVDVCDHVCMEERDHYVKEMVGHVRAWREGLGQ